MWLVPDGFGALGALAAVGYALIGLHLGVLGGCISVRGIAGGFIRNGYLHVMVFMVTFGSPELGSVI